MGTFKTYNEAEFRLAFGKRLVKLRTKAGFSSEGFANHVDISRTLISGYEKGTTHIGGKNLVKVLNGLKITAEEFFAEGFE